MTTNRTTVQIGFNADTAALANANAKLAALQATVERLSRSMATMGAASRQAGQSLGSGIGSAAGVGGTVGGQGGVLGSGAGGVPGPGGSGGIGGILGGLLGGRMLAGGGAAGKLLQTGLGALKAIPGIGLAAAGVGTLGAGLVLRGMFSYRQYARELDPLHKQLGLVGERQDRFNRALTDTTRRLSISRSEVLAHTKAYTALAGAVQGAQSIITDVRGFQGFAKGAGMDLGQTASQMGNLAQSGAYGALAGQKGLDARRFTLLLGEAISKGNMMGRGNEMLQGIQSLVRMQAQTLARPTGVEGMFAFMGQMGASKVPGLMGAAGANVLGTISQGITNPGAGAYGEWMMAQALGHKNFYAFKQAQEEGAFGKTADGRYNVMALVDYLRGQYDDVETRSWAAKQLVPGLSMSQYKAFDNAVSQFHPREESEFISRIEKFNGGRGVEALDTRKVTQLAQIHAAKTPEELRALAGDSANPVLKAAVADWDRPFKEQQDAAFKAVMTSDYMKSDIEKLETSLETINTTIIDLGEKFWRPMSRIFDFFGVPTDGGPRKVQPGREFKGNTVDQQGITGRSSLVGPDLFDRGGKPQPAASPKASGTRKVSKPVEERTLPLGITPEKWAGLTPQEKVASMKAERALHNSGGHKAARAPERGDTTFSVVVNVDGETIHRQVQTVPAGNGNTGNHFTSAVN